MAEAATDGDLVETFNRHLSETENHVGNLEQVFDVLGHKPSKIDVEAIRGLIADAEWAIDQDSEKAVLDAMLIAAALYIEHYEIAGYTTATNWANLLGYAEIEDLLAENLTEEELAAESLSALAEEKVDSASMGNEEL